MGQYLRDKKFYVIIIYKQKISFIPWKKVYWYIINFMTVVGKALYYHEKNYIYIPVYFFYSQESYFVKMKVFFTHY